MYIPSWILWTLGIFGWLILSFFVGRERGTYDFFSPILGVSVFLIGAAFGAGMLISKL